MTRFQRNTQTFRRPDEKFNKTIHHQVSNGTKRRKGDQKTYAVLGRDFSLGSDKRADKQTSLLLRLRWFPSSSSSIQQLIVLIWKVTNNQNHKFSDYRDYEDRLPDRRKSDVIEEESVEEVEKKKNRRRRWRRRRIAVNFFFSLIKTLTNRLLPRHQILSIKGIIGLIRIKPKYMVWSIKI